MGGGLMDWNWKWRYSNPEMTNRQNHKMINRQISDVYEEICRGPFYTIIPSMMNIPFAIYGVCSFCFQRKIREPYVLEYFSQTFPSNSHNTSMKWKSLFKGMPRI